MRRALVLTWITLLAPAAVWAEEQETQDVLTCTELDADGKQTGLKLGHAVDLNSTVSFEIDVDALRRRLATEFESTEVPPELLRRLTTLEESAEHALRGQAELQQLMADPKVATLRGSDFTKRLQPVAKHTVLALDAAESDPRLDERLNDALVAQLSVDNSIVAQYGAVLTAIREEARLAEAELDELLEDADVYVQVGAWVAGPGGERPVHVPGFDDYDYSDYSEIPRWVVFDDDSAAKLEVAAKRAEKINNTEGGLATTFTQGAPDLLSELANTSRRCLEQTENNLAAVIDELDSSSTLAKDLQQAQTSLERLIAGLERLIEHVRSPDSSQSPAQLLLQTQEDVKALQELVTEASQTFEGITDDIEEIATSDTTLLELLDALRTSLSECEAQVTSSDYFESLQGLIVLLKGQELGGKTFQFGDQVQKHDLSGLPSEGRVALRLAGPRAAGEQLVIQVGAGADGQSSRALEVEAYRLSKVLWHLDTTVNVIFADPDVGTDVRNRFQAAPSYSVLLRRGFRDAPFVDRFLRPGFGVNVAALDFNHDDTPEIGVGPVVSLFRDYVQIGYGYNVPQDVSYWYFGLGLPLPSISLTPGKGSIDASD